MSIPATISQGATGATVEWLQYNLVRRTLSDASEIDGIFGPVRRNAVEEFQSSVGLLVDGIVGLQTWALSVHAAGSVIADLVGVRLPG